MRFAYVEILKGLVGTPGQRSDLRHPWIPRKDVLIAALGVRDFKTGLIVVPKRERNISLGISSISLNGNQHGMNSAKKKKKFVGH